MDEQQAIPIYDPIELLLADIVEEAMIEIVANEDVTTFWVRCTDDLFAGMVIEFNKDYTGFISSIAGIPECFNYFVKFTHRILAKPYSKDALIAFLKVQERFTSTPEIGKLLVTNFNKDDEVKILYFLIASYSSIIQYRINRIKVDQGKQ